MISKFELIMFYLKVNHCLPGHDDDAERRIAWGIIEAEDCLGPLEDHYFNFEFIQHGVMVKLRYGDVAISQSVSWHDVSLPHPNVLVEIKRELWRKLCG